MSYLSTALNEMLKRHQMKPAVLARLSKVAEPKLSRWLRGTQAFISNEDLAKIADHLTQSPKEAAELVVARMRDVCTGPGSKLITLSISGEPVRDVPATFGTKLPPKIEEAIKAIIDHADDPDVKNLLLCIGNLLRKGDASID